MKMGGEANGPTDDPPKIGLPGRRTTTAGGKNKWTFLGVQFLVPKSQERFVG